MHYFSMNIFGHPHRLMRADIILPSKPKLTKKHCNSSNSPVRPAQDILRPRCQYRAGTPHPHHKKRAPRGIRAITPHKSWNRKINCTHERAPRITHNDKSSPYGEPLTKDRSVTIHHRNIRALAIEIYKVMQGISPPSLNEVFVPRQCNYELRGNNFLVRRRVKSVRYGTESISSLAPKIWKSLPNEIKVSGTLQIFKAKTKKWVPVECPCRLCKIYLLQVETTFI